MRPASIEGMKLFHGKAHCSVCHRGPNLSNGQFHNLGVGWNGSRFADQGRFAVTGIIKDKGAFKTPTLRQVAQTAPYMHDGSLATLDEVVEFYNRGGNPNPHLDPLIQPRKLNAQEKRWLVEFLKSLTGDITLY
jgi:cytochrome c peroxidase